MCLGIPGRVVEKLEGYSGQLAMVDVLGAARRVNIGMLEDAEQAALAPGDWVIIHMGFIVERVDEAAAEKAMSGLELMGQARDTPEPQAQSFPALIDVELPIGELPRVG